MKAKLKVYVAGEELFKEIDIDFVPSPGLTIELDEEIHDDNQREAYRASLEKHGITASPYFLVDRVIYRVADRSLYLDVSLRRKREAVNQLAIEQLVYGFGFTTWAQWMQGMEQRIEAFEDDEGA